MVEAGTLGDRYRLQDEIAAGGMGSVHVATDERLGRQVAVKLMKPELAQDTQFVERFRREARAAAALSHPHIANVFDYGEDEGRHFIVMEYVSGKDLARLVREEGPLEPERATALAVQVCEALSHAHAAGVVHRDIKPANIMVAGDDRVKVTDFGIARAAGDTTLTAAGLLLGSAHYMSPEQARGDKVTPASDIYSLGIVLYEMLTGAVPFTADSPVSVAMRHVNEELPAPSALNPAVPAELDHVVTKATAKEPLERYRDAAAVAAALAPIAGTAAAVAAALAPIAGTAAPATAPLSTPAPTALLGASGTTAEDRLLPLPDRWDAAKLGKVVLLSFAALVVIAALLLIGRLVSNQDERAGAERRPQAGGGAGEPANTSTPSGVPIPENLIGEPFDQVKTFFDQHGIKVDEEKEEGSELQEGLVSDIEPPPGSIVLPGEEVTVYVSKGPADEDEGDEEGGGPGKSEKAPGHEKKEED